MLLYLVILRGLCCKIQQAMSQCICKGKEVSFLKLHHIVQELISVLLKAVTQSLLKASKFAINVQHSNRLPIARRNLLTAVKDAELGTHKFKLLQQPSFLSP